MMSGLTIDHSDATAGRRKPVEHDCSVRQNASSGIRPEDHPMQDRSIAKAASCLNRFEGAPLVLGLSKARVQMME